MLRGLKRVAGNPSDLNRKQKRTTDKKELLRPLGYAIPRDDAEKHLEKLVFGAEGEVLEELGKLATKQRPNDSKLAFTEHTKAVWTDEDDNDSESVIPVGKDARYKQVIVGNEESVPSDVLESRLKKQYEKITGTPHWAQLKSEKGHSDSDSGDDDLVQTTGNYVTNSQYLPKGSLNIKKCRDVNKEKPSKAKIKSVEFHPSSQVILAAGMDQTLNLFQVDGKNNPHIQSLFLESFPILTAHFSSEGHEAILCSRHNTLYYYDMMAGKLVKVPPNKGMDGQAIGNFDISPDGRFIVIMGKHGYMHLLSAKTKEWIHSCKMNGSVNAIAFTQNGQRMLSHGDDGDVYVWNMQTRDCIHRFVDDGCIGGTSLAISKNGQYLACGSDSGVVNIYDDQYLLSPHPKPLKSLMNLTTSCTGLKFNSTSEVLAMSSDYTENAVRMVHFPSMTVYSNYPERTDTTRIPFCMDFSLNSGYFSLGNNKGQALLYRLKHYENY